MTSPRRVADDVWEAFIEPSTVGEKVVGLLRVMATNGMNSRDIGGHAIVRDRETGDEIMWGDAGGDPVWMLDQLQRDLRTMTEESFRAKWDENADWPGTLQNSGS